MHSLRSRRDLFASDGIRDVVRVGDGGRDSALVGAWGCEDGRGGATLGGRHGGQVARIPGALFFDVVGISDRASNLPHLLSKEEAFAATVSALGIQNKDGLVVYDGKGIFSAARVWWMFRAFRHERVWVLDGGLPQWRATRFDVESGASGDPILNASIVSEVVEKVYKGQAVAPIPFQTKYQPHLVWTLEQCLAVLFFVGGFCVGDLYSESDDKTWV
ncbi:hypothetical protein IFM89_017832 [Coptis chinensis]|uniref:Rhodanese domain-containing protein n=1 Tax=Coptis chinensis TaxID=261450 RepID=A0A835LVE6_9MAGN|nr:hypothetical protein IFM89_017832 [Coptis chinensis]